MIQECKYDKVKDITPVSQTGWIDLAECFRNSSVPTMIDDTDVAYNGIEDPASILGRPRDVFEATRMMSYINDAGQVKEEA